MHCNLRLVLPSSREKQIEREADRQGEKQREADAEREAKRSNAERSRQRSREIEAASYEREAYKREAPAESYLVSPPPITTASKSREKLFRSPPPLQN